MDLSSLTNHSPDVLKVVQALKNDPNFVAAFKENPEEALQQINVTLTEEELATLQKISSFRELGGEVVGIWEKIKGFLGIK